MIEDAELRELFEAESEEHLESLDSGLLRLESSPHDGATLEEVFRAAHSLKGTARMLGVSGVETLAHHLEDELGQARRGRATLSPATIDRLSVGLDAVRALVAEAVTGAPAHIDISRVLAQMSGRAPLDTSNKSGAEPTPPQVLEPAPLAPLTDLTDLQAPIGRAANVPPGASPALPEALPEALPGARPIALAQTSEQTRAIGLGTEMAPPAEAVILAQLDLAQPDSGRATLARREEPMGEPAELAQPEESKAETEPPLEARGDFKIQTMRVPPSKLDALMTLAGELTVTTNRVERGLAALSSIGEMCEEWSKDLAAQRPFLAASSASNALDEAPGGAATRRLSDFHEREAERLGRFRALWQQVREGVYEDAGRLGSVAGELEEGIRKVRLLPFSTIFNLFPRAVRDLARAQGKAVDFVIEGGETTADKRILEELKDPLMHMIRNAVDHGVEAPAERERAGKPGAATLRLRASQTASNIVVELHDDGRGLDVEAIRRTAIKRRLHTQEELDAMTREQVQLLIFAPGFSTAPLVTDVSGRGVGMDVVRANIESLKGSVQALSAPGEGTSFVIRLPLTLATARVLLAEVHGRPYALPIEFVHSIVRVEPAQFFAIGGRQTVVLNQEAVPIASLWQLLELSEPAPSSTWAGSLGGWGSLDQAQFQVCVVLCVGPEGEKLGLLVDAVLDEQEVVLKALGPMLKRVRNVSGATILGAGEVCMVLNPHDLLRSASRSRLAAALTEGAQASQEFGEESARRKVILLAEDSITTRTQEKRILESAGYEVVTAVDGADALAKLGTRAFDAVVSDVEMPNLDGLGLAARIRQDARHKEMPIILVTSLASDEDRRRGAEVGANAYITKGTFDQQVLVDALRRLA